MDETLNFLRENGFTSANLEGAEYISQEALSTMSREELIGYINALHGENKRLQDRISDVKYYNNKTQNLASEIESKYELLRSAIRELAQA